MLLLMSSHLICPLMTFTKDQNQQKIYVASYVMLSAKTFPLTDMNRSELQDQLIQQIIDDMDIKTMAALLYDMMDESYDKYSEKELKNEVEEYYPHILEESNTN